MHKPFHGDDLVIIINGCSSLLPSLLSAEGNCHTDQQSEQQPLERREAQRESSNPTPSQSPRTGGNDDKETKASPL